MKTLLWFVFLFTVACSEGPDIVAEEESDMSIKRITPFYDDFDARAANIDRGRKLPTVLSLEPDAGPWTASNNFGNTVPFSDNDANRFTILKTIPSRPKVRSITLHSNYQDKDGNFALFANVLVGCGGVLNEFTMDWVNGLSFSVVASNIEIVAEYTPDARTGVISVPSDLQLSATSGDGVLPGDHPIFYTPPSENDSIVGAATGDVHIIPRYASKLFILNRSAANMDVYTVGNYIIFWRSFAGTLIVARIPITADSCTIDGIKIPNGAHSWSLTNTSATVVQFFPRYELGL